MNYDSLYDRVAAYGKARVALSMPQTFAKWGKEQMVQVPDMMTWLARQWIAAFLLEATGIPWIVEAATIDLAAMPRRDPNKPLAAHEQATDNEPVPLPAWVIELAQPNVSGAVMAQFIERTTQDSPPRIKLTVMRPLK